jgi:hypothetical protein
MLSLIMFHISLVFDYTMSVLVSLESGFNFLTTALECLKLLER